jgi:chorismate dehydratase
MRRLRISAISYLNTAPLMWDFEHGDAGSEFDISYTLPSACARALGRDRRHRDYSGGRLRANPRTAGIARCRDRLAAARALDSAGQQGAGRKDSHRRFGYVFDDLGGADESFVRKMAGRRKNIHPDGSRHRQNAGRHDAGLLIGDPALQIDRSRYLTLDLAEEWIRYTGKPFVFAFWAVRQDAWRKLIRASRSASDLC